jgi:hypothetical protein
MNLFTKSVLGISLVGALIGGYFASNIKGYYRFKEICQKEGGLRVYQPLEKGVGWMVDGSIGGTLTFFGASYSRTRKDDGNYYDTVLKTPFKQKYFEKDFETTLADLSKQPIYKLKSAYNEIPNELRLSSHTTEVIEIATGKTLVAYRQFGYESFERKNTLLDAPSGNTCPEYANFGRQDSQTRLNAPGDLYLGIQSAVK